jgi:hypothetical protein
MTTNAASIKEVNVLKWFQEKPYTCVGLDDKKTFLVFRKDKESELNFGKLLKTFMKVLEMKHLSLQAQNMT